MRRPVVALFAVLLALSLAGCGGGGDEAPPEDAVVAPPAAPVAPLDTADPIPDRSAQETVTFEPFPMSTDIPASVTERIEQKQPMLMLFVDDEQKDSDDLTAEVRSVVNRNKGLVDLMIYDIGKYSTVDTDGNVRVDATKLDEDEKTQESVTLARAVGVTFAPYVLIVDDQGHVIYRHSGFVDRELIERQVLRVTD